MPSTTFIRATESFAFIGPAGPINIRKGETFHKDAKRLENCPPEALEGNFQAFSPDHDVETATAAPGERRKGRPRRTKPESEPETGDAEAAKEDAANPADAETKK